MDTGRKDANIQIGKRLREARLNMNLEKSEIADVLGVTVEHYRKLEAGITGISVDKVLTLYHKYGIDPTYLITGESSMKDFNLDYYVANSTKEQRNEFFDRVLAYLSKLIRLIEVLPTSKLLHLFTSKPEKEEVLCLILRSVMTAEQM